MITAQTPHTVRIIQAINSNADCLAKKAQRCAPCVNHGTRIHDSVPIMAVELSVTAGTIDPERQQQPTQLRLRFKAASLAEYYPATHA